MVPSTAAQSRKVSKSRWVPIANLAGSRLTLEMGIF